MGGWSVVHECVVAGVPRGVRCVVWLALELGAVSFGTGCVVASEELAELRAHRGVVSRCATVVTTVATWRAVCLPVLPLPLK